MFTKYASAEYADVLDLKGSKGDRIYTASLDKISEYNDFRTDDDYLYVRIRAISSRVNQNHDGWPTVELAGSPEILSKHHSSDGFTVEASSGNPKYGFATFMHKPIFVDHNNGDPKKTRGMIVDAKFNVLSKEAAKLDPYWSSRDVDPQHLPAAEIELLLEIDAKNFPKFAKAVKKGHIDGFSMGCNCEFSVCSHCGNKASSADQFCSHVKLKGVEHDYKTASGERIKKKSYENVGGVQFFEISGVFNPADETALTKEVIASLVHEGEFYNRFGEPDDFDPIRDNTDNVRDFPPMPNGEVIGNDDPSLQQSQAPLQPHLPPGAQVDRNGLPIGALPPNRPGQPSPFINGEEDVPFVPGYPNQPVMNNPTLSSVHTAENELPQSMKVHAPEPLDTLRDEHICPVCGAQMEGETCEVCGYTEPPKEFDNPDLNKAKQIREDMKAVEEAQATPGGGVGQQAPNQQMPNNSQTTASVNSRMSWTPLVTEKTAAKINKVEVPVLQPNTIVTNQPSNQTVLSDQKSPVTSAMLTAQRLMATAQRNHLGESMSNTRVADGATPPAGTAPKTQVDVVGVGGFDEASNEAASAAQRQIDVTGIGGTGVEGVEPDHTESLPTADAKGDDSGFNTDKTTDDSGPTKTFGDSDGSHPGVTDPVTSDPFPASEDGVKAANAYYAAVKKAQDEYAAARLAYDDSTLEKNEQQGNDPASTKKHVKGTEPSDPVGKAQDRINPADPATSTKNNSGSTDTWHGTDGNGVTKQQDPVTKENMEFGGVTTPDVKLHTGAVRLSSLKLAELEIELGLTPADEKYNRIADLDSYPESVVHAKIETLSQVKTAGVAKLTHVRTAGATKVPSLFGKATAAPNGFARIASDHQTHETPIDDSGLDSAIFVR